MTPVLPALRIPAVSARLREWPRDSEDRNRYADAIFGTIADRYDLLVRLLSFGQDGRWKRKIVGSLRSGTTGARHLDLATGTAGIPLLIRRRAFAGAIVGLDRSRAMLANARRKRGEISGIDFVRGDLNRLPFRRMSFHAVTMGYGLRYLSDIKATLAEILGLLTPGGVLVCLDFGLPRRRWNRRLSLGYLLTLGTIWGLVLHRQADTYWHIAESLLAYPGQDAVAAMMREVGFVGVTLEEHLGGSSVVARGLKPG